MSGCCFVGIIIHVLHSGLLHDLLAFKMPQHKLGLTNAQLSDKAHCKTQPTLAHIGLTRHEARFMGICKTAVMCMFLEVHDGLMSNPKLKMVRFITFSLRFQSI